MENFTRDHALVLVGRLIRSKVAFSGVPAGTKGRVVRADDDGGGRWTVAIEWDLPAERPSLSAGDVAGEPFVLFQRGGPLVDWFSRDEYERFLEELLA